MPHVAAPPVPVLTIGPPPFQPCALSGGTAAIPGWFGLPVANVMDGQAPGRAVDPILASRQWYHPPPSVRRGRHPRGLTLAPHSAGLVVKDACGWAASNTALRRGAVITWVDNIAWTDRPAMVRALAATDPEGSHWVTATAEGFVWPYEWSGYPLARDVRI